MSNRELLKTWIQESSLLLTADQEAYFIQLWKKGKIYYDDPTVTLDDVDQFSSKLACSALDKRIFTLLIFPDHKKHRAALIFTTMVVKYALACIEGSKRRNKILYIGSDFKFKHCINATFVGSLAISRIFPYIEISKKKKNDNDGSSIIRSECLPEVTCVFSPTNPEEYVNNLHPEIVVIDCSKSYEIEWLDSILKFCKKKNISVLCWGSNYFSQVPEIVESNNGSVFYFPRINKQDTNLDIATLYLDNQWHIVTPLLLAGANSRLIEKELSQVKIGLKKMKMVAKGNLQIHSLRLAWRYMKVVENMIVPINIYNSEAHFFWGAYPLNKYAGAIAEFRTQIQKVDPGFSEELNRFLSSIGEVIENMAQSFPPFWQALSNYCVENKDIDGIRIIIFQTKYQKQLFNYTLLSKYNITEEELLSDFQVITKTINEYIHNEEANSRTYEGNKLYPILVGLPDIYTKMQFYELLSDSLKILIYPSQLPALQKVISDFNLIEKAHLKKSIKTLKRISGRSDEVNLPAKADRYAVSSEVEEYRLDSKKSNSDLQELNPLLDIGDLESEIASLFKSKDEMNRYEIDDNLVDNISFEHSENSTDEKIIQFEFEEGFLLNISENEQLGAIRNGKLDEIYVRSLSVGQKVMLIHDQARQNLYDLILSRVHHHPSLEVHMAILKRWKDDIRLHYMRWRREDREVNELLANLQSRGSMVTSPVTIHNWLNGATLRPQDDMDILRIGEALQIKFVKDNYKRIADAAARIVGIHITLSRKLNDWIGKNAFRSHQDNMEIIDRELGLTFGELTSSIRILTIKKISPLQKGNLVTTLGRLIKINAN